MQQHATTVLVAEIWARHEAIGLRGVQRGTGLAEGVGNGDGDVREGGRDDGAEGQERHLTESVKQKREWHHIDW